MPSSSLCRHLNLSQTVTLTIITAGDALERAKLLHRYITVAQLLQSQKYGNLFSFLAVMQGLAAPQVRGGGRWLARGASSNRSRLGQTPWLYLIHTALNLQA